jgi:pimeloyl-ACP methyl ester carboxylesterase
MSRVRSNGIEIEYEEFGRPDDPVLLLICGLGSQLLSWDVELCAMFVERGFRVVRFDNRDVGLSTSFAGVTDQNITSALAGDATTAPYSLDDMADDTAGLLDAIGVDAAHVVGVSMGGMIAQSLAIRHPHKVASLCSIMSTTGDPSVGGPTPAALEALLRPPPTTRDEAIEGALRTTAVIGSPGFPAEEARLRDRAGRAWDRATERTGAGRQILAVVTSPDRTEALGRLEVPTLVIHGREDPLIDVSGGEATARAVPGAELLVIPGMGHEVSVPLWPQLVDAIVANASKVAVR